jgi:cardiolipin synthase A/B
MDLLLVLIVVLNICFAISIIFIERKTPEIALAWLTVLVFLPVIGFLVYLAFGRNFYRTRLFKLKEEEDKKLEALVTTQISDVTRIDEQSDDENKDRFLRVIRMLLTSNNALVTQNNAVEIYTDGVEKFKALFAEIEKATDFIHVQYFYISSDGLGREFRDLLTKKAGEGVEVKVLVDGLPFTFTSRNFWKPLKNAGGNYAIFFPGFLRYINFRFNNRNHRKIVVIDGKTAFCGGFNVGDDYIGKGKIGYWRDTHIKINGKAALPLEMRFLMDWNYAAKKDTLEFSSRYFPQVEDTGTAALQVISSGPDNEHNQIKEAYLKLINTAKESVYIQTPYFIPDQSIFDALRLAALSGVDVRIMIPCKPDHPLVYTINHAFIRDMLHSGVKAYTYDDGFIHSKTVVIDGMVASVGSANWDIRSFKLNFETNVLIYNPEYASRLRNIFEQDLKKSTEITLESFDKRPVHEKIWEPIARLFSPIL